MKFIVKVSENSFNDLTDIWEDSVRATHDFLSEKEILRLRSLILNLYLSTVDLRAYKKNDDLCGFMGISENKLEMLFISPVYFKQGIGSALLNYAIKELGVITLDVNEQNSGAFNFYKKMGFKVIGRSDVDGEGNPYPLLHMKLAAKNG